MSKNDPPRMMTPQSFYDHSSLDNVFRDMIDQKILYVTGCLGFIGSHFTRKALELGHRVFGVDKMTYASNSALLDEFREWDTFSFLQEDIKELDHLYDCDYVVNFAAESHVENSITKSDEFINSNVLGVKNLLDLVRNKHENTGDRPVFFQISTDEVYGDIVEGAHTESDLLKPSNPYSASKASADMLVLAWARTYNIRYLILRPTNNYGVGQYPEKLIPLCIKNLNRGKKIRLHEGGSPKRNWLHADDTAQAVIDIINSGRTDEIFNVAGGFEQSNYQTVKDILFHYFGEEVDIENYVDFTYGRKGQDVRYALDDSKLRSLGWAPNKVFSEELKIIVSHFNSKFYW